MRKITKKQYIETLKKLLLESNFSLDKETENLLEDSLQSETNVLGKNILSQIKENLKIAKTESIPICQDTGMVVVFLEIGKVDLDFNVYDATNEAVRIAYKEGYLRKSVLNHPLERNNTNDNTPAIIHTNLRQDDQLRITVAPKGGGAENMSRIAMLTPAEGKQGVIDFVLETIKYAGGKACPPFIVGVGIGGNLEKCALLAKEAILRPVNDSSNIAIDKSLEDELLRLINSTDIGPMGFGGKTTALAVKVNSYPCHIASLPVAVNIQCHASRHRSVIL